MTVAKVLKEAQKLDVDERKLLVRKILGSIEQDGDGPMSPEVKIELDRRWAAHLKNPEAGYTIDQIMEKLKRARIQRRKKRNA